VGGRSYISPRKILLSDLGNISCVTQEKPYDIKHHPFAIPLVRFLYWRLFNAFVYPALLLILLSNMAEKKRGRSEHANDESNFKEVVTQSGEIQLLFGACGMHPTPIDGFASKLSPLPILSRICI
jgi:hypothetical protein